MGTINSLLHPTFGRTIKNAPTGAGLDNSAATFSFVRHTTRLLTAYLKGMSSAMAFPAFAALRNRTFRTRITRMHPSPFSKQNSFGHHSPVPAGRERNVSFFNAILRRCGNEQLFLRSCGFPSASPFSSNGNIRRGVPNVSEQRPDHRPSGKPGATISKLSAGAASVPAGLSRPTPTGTARVAARVLARGTARGGWVGRGGHCSGTLHTKWSPTIRRVPPA